MTNEKKAEELRKTALPTPLPDGYGMWLSAGDVDWVLIKMAEWKEQQMIEKACEWLEPVFKNLAGYYSGATLLDDFKKTMED